jgi:hypothetical protein
VENEAISPLSDGGAVGTEPVLPSLSTAKILGGVIVSVALAAVIAVAAGRILPYADDEFEKYFALACTVTASFHHPISAIGNICANTLSRIPFSSVVVPLGNAAWYNGSISSLYYAPLYFLWRSPDSARFVGVLFLLGQAFVFSRLFRFRFAPVAAGFLLLFPYAFQHLVDTGPLGPQLLVVFLLYALFDDWLRSPRPWVLPLCAFLMFLSLWSKLTFVWLLPGLGLLFLFQLAQGWSDLSARLPFRRLLAQAAVAALCFVVPLIVLLLSTSELQQGISLYLQGWNTTETYSFIDMLRGVWRGSEALVPGLRDPLFATQWIWEYDGNRTDLFLSLYYPFLLEFVPAGIVLLALFARRSVRELLRPTVFYALFWLTFFLMLRNQTAGRMHHVLVAFPFLIFGIGSVVSLMLATLRERPLPVLRWYLAASALFFVALNVDAYYRAAPPDPALKTSQIALTRILNDPSVIGRYDIVVLDYDVIFRQALYGNPAQHLRFVRKLRGERPIVALRNEIEAEGRKMLFVFTPGSSSSNVATIQSMVSLEPCASLPENPYFGILLESDPAAGTACSVM